MDVDKIPVAMSAGDTTWVVISGALVFLMCVFLASFYATQVHRKDMVALYMKVFITFAVVTITWAVIGFSIAFSPGPSGFIGGTEYVFLQDMWGGKVWAGTRIPDVAFFFFQMMFAIVTPALVVGAIAGRMKFSAWVLFAGLWSLFVYPVIAHWVFSPDGWLYKLGARDFAGGIVIHASAGATALVLAKMLGPRRDEKPDPNPFSPHWTRPLMILSTGVLWFGWFGFNGGSALAMGARGTAVNAVVATHFAAVTGSTMWLLLDRLKGRKPTMQGLCTGAVAGLAAVTPASGYVSAMSGALIGAVAGIVCYQAINIKKFFKADDALDVVGVHGGGGVVGALMLGGLAYYPVNPVGLTSEAGEKMSGSWSFVLHQLIAVGSIVAYTAIVTIIITWVVKIFVGLRVSEEVERAGLDGALHGEELVSTPDPQT